MIIGLFANRRELHIDAPGIGTAIFHNLLLNLFTVKIIAIIKCSYISRSISNTASDADVWQVLSLCGPPNRQCARLNAEILCCLFWV